MLKAAVEMDFDGETVVVHQACSDARQRTPLASSTHTPKDVSFAFSSTASSSPKSRDTTPFDITLESSSMDVTTKNPYKLTPFTGSDVMDLTRWVLVHFSFCSHVSTSRADAFSFNAFEIRVWGEPRLSTQFGQLPLCCRHRCRSTLGAIETHGSKTPGK